MVCGKNMNKLDEKKQIVIESVKASCNFYNLFKKRKFFSFNEFRVQFNVVKYTNEYMRVVTFDTY